MNYSYRKKEKKSCTIELPINKEKLLQVKSSLLASTLLKGAVT